MQLSGNAVFHMYGGTIQDCHNTHSVSGGVLVNESASFLMNTETIIRCSGLQDGGGVIGNGSFNLNNGVIRECADHWYGGGAVNIYGKNVSFTMNNRTLTNCSANQYGYGGAVFIYTENGSVNIWNGTITNSTACNYGGGLFLYNGTAAIAKEVPLYNNTAGTAGDDIFVNSGRLTLGTVPEGLSLQKCKHSIDGWYEDGEVRWNETNKQSIFPVQVTAY